MRYTIKHLPPKRYLVIGKEEELSPILEEVRKASMNKIQIYSYLNPSPATLAATIEMETARPYDAILIGDPQLARGVDTIVNQAERNGIGVEYLPLVVESTLKRVPIGLIDTFKDYYDVAFSSIHKSYRKRAFDLLFSAFFLIIASPLIIVLSIAIPLESGWPIIFKQKRIGMNMMPFMFMKFRSLVNVSQSELDKLDDPNATISQRVTRVGKLIRKVRLDEIPQFLNVIQGTMSIVGPRPEMVNYHKQALESIHYYSYRYKLKPGITGWAQINYPHTSTMEDYRKKTEYDLYYIKNQSFRLDLEITLKTIETMLGMRGSK
jgi:lipopolysaccharide/colanic/teichoic acid biosynthesis glycosyltransferase